MRARIQRVHTCSYCKHGTHIIDTTIHPNDFLAKKDSSGKWICGDCIETQIQDMIKASKKRRGVS
jgi:transcription elongation factor Elf1